MSSRYSPRNPAAPLSPDELQEFFGTDRPSAQSVEEHQGFWESIERGMARYVIIYEDDIPKSVFFAGYSFD